MKNACEYECVEKFLRIFASYIKMYMNYLNERKMKRSDTNITALYNIHVICNIAKLICDNDIDNK